MQAFWDSGKDNIFVVVLGKSIFHPQGGGQPSDEGTIRNGDKKFMIKSLQSKDEAVLHFGLFEKVRL